MRKFFEEGKLTTEAISAIMSEEKPNQREKIVLRGDRVRSLIPKNIPINQTEEYVLSLIHIFLFTEEIGGIFTVEYSEEGDLELKTEALEADAMYDDIGGPLRIKQLQEEKRELFRSLELFYQVFFLGLDVEGLEND